MTVKKRPGEIVQVNLRMREDFRQRLLREAEKGERSFNQELVRRLEESFRRDDVDDALGRASAMVGEAHGLLKGWEDRFAALEVQASQSSTSDGQGTVRMPSRRERTPGRTVGRPLVAVPLVGCPLLAAGRTLLKYT